MSKSLEDTVASHFLTGVVAIVINSFRIQGDASPACWIGKAEISEGTHDRDRFLSRMPYTKSIIKLCRRVTTVGGQQCRAKKVILGTAIARAVIARCLYRVSLLAV